jgi:hypothetical protein
MRKQARFTTASVYLVNVLVVDDDCYSLFSSSARAKRDYEIRTTIHHHHFASLVNR